MNLINNVSNNQITTMLIYLLAFMLFILLVLVVVFVYIKVKDNKRKKEEEIKQSENAIDVTNEAKLGTNTATKGYNKQSIMNFMEFDKIEDNMIVQKNGNRYLMVIECQGVNYDLMSSMEQTAVEEGFIQFLNSLRFPIQIYVQTRTVNLENSITGYKQRVNEVESTLRQKEKEYDANRQSGLFTKEELKAQYYDLIKTRNLYEYGKDIVYNTEQMSLNKNVLNKNYYIITSYYSSELGENDFDKEEVKNVAFSELYTRCQGIIVGLSASGVNGKILDSNSLVELLYMAYNRDEAEAFGLDKALEAQYDELYTSAPDVLDKKIAALDKEIEEKAMTKAEDVVEKVRTERERKLEERKVKMEDIIDEMAKLIIQENSAYLGQEVTNSSIQELNQSEQRRRKAKEKVEEEEEKEDEQEKTKKTRRTAKRA